MPAPPTTSTPPNPPLTPTPILLLDGGLGTTLADSHGVTFDDSTPLWSSHTLLSPSGRDLLQRVQTDFVRNGADVLLTATYQASFEGFGRSGVVGEREARRLMRGAVVVAGKAFEEGSGIARKERKGRVVLGLGAYGATMLPGQEYSGNYDDEHSSIAQLKDWHLRRIRAFFPDPNGEEEEEERWEKEKCWEGVNMVAFETLPRIDEILAAREVMASLPKLEGGERDFWISCVLPGEGNKLPDGSDIRAVVGAMLGDREGAGRPWGIGINCTKLGKVGGIVGEFESAVRELLGADDGQGNWPALVLYPDGTRGEVYNTTTKVWELKSEAGEVGNEKSWDATLYEIVQRIRERNLWSTVVVGGCCKVTPGHIGSLKKRFDPSSK